MAKPIVTQELVTSIADELHAAGVEPSILMVQERIGAGSYTTVKRYLDHCMTSHHHLRPEVLRS